jgi:hypothetical protein
LEGVSVAMGDGMDRRVLAISKMKIAGSKQSREYI